MHAMPLKSVTGLVSAMSRRAGNAAGTFVLHAAATNLAAAYGAYVVGNYIYKAVTGNENKNKPEKVRPVVPPVRL